LIQTCIEDFFYSCGLIKSPYEFRVPGYLHIADEFIDLLGYKFKCTKKFKKSLFDVQKFRIYASGKISSLSFYAKQKDIIVADFIECRK
jgi:hypothetical protein